MKSFLSPEVLKFALHHHFRFRKPKKSIEHWRN